MQFENLLVESQYDKHIALVRFNRPKELNALNRKLMEELRDALKALDDDEEVRVIVLTGNERAFAAGADIKEMADRSAIDMVKIDQFTTWDQIKKTKKPIIAAVSGFALGGGCELAMTCDMIIASESAQFGQPEIKIGVIPGAGGTQRLTRAVGKARAMELVLTGKFINAEEALRMGLINRIVPVELYLSEAVKLAKEIAAMSPIAVRMGKEAVLQSYSGSLEEGLQFERKNFYMLFASEDQKEGMSAFVDKRKPDFKGK
ncbi:MAG: enoyl-CoA hydratase-related protein [Chitinophagales bacterium]|nr:enoyl-CoA hydratase-related protein [Chitinophagales bacterium]